MDDLNSENDLSNSNFQHKSKEVVSAKTMLEQRKRALTHHKRMQNYNQAHQNRRQTVQDAKK
jgi:hypothetical protein